MQIHLTDLTVRALTPGIYFDTKTPRFGIWIGKQKRTWIVLLGPRSDKKKLGVYPSMSLQEARRKALAAISSAYQPARAPAFHEALEQYLARDQWKESTRYEIRRTLTKYFHWQKPIDKITHNDVALVIEDIEAKSEAAHALKDLKAFFNWCVPRYISHSPCEGLRTPHRYIPRDKLLTDDEIRNIWNAAGELGGYGECIRLLICTGQRANQILRLKNEWIVDGHIHFPPAVMKGGRAHSIALGSLAASILTWQPRPSDYQGKMKARLDSESGVTGYVLHDFRRYVASTMAAVGIALPTVEYLLAHRSHSFAGIVSVYQQYNWLVETKQAIERYENHLRQLLDLNQ